MARPKALKETTANTSKAPAKSAKTGAGVKKNAATPKAKKPAKKRRGGWMWMTAEEAARGGPPGYEIDSPPKPKPRAKKAANPKKKTPLMAMSEEDEQQPMPIDEPSLSNAQSSTAKQQNGPENPYEYILIPRPYWDCEDEVSEYPSLPPGKIYTAQQIRDFLANRPKRLSADDMYNASEKEVYPTKDRKPTKAADRPDHPWVLMIQAVIDLNEAHRQLMYRCPDNFGMYIYNDFEGYGQVECIENFLLTHDKLYLQKPQNLTDLWKNMATLGMFLAQSGLDALMGIDDGERYFALMELVGLAFLATLNELHLAGKLSAESELKDIGAVMGAFVSAGAMHDSEDTGNWTQFVVRYAIDRKIEGPARRLRRLMREHTGPVSIPKAAGDKWSFRKKLRAYKQEQGKIGGHQFDITKMSVAARKRAAFDGRDPLAGAPEGAFLDFA